MESSLHRPHIFFERGFEWSFPDDSLFTINGHQYSFADFYAHPNDAGTTAQKILRSLASSHSIEGNDLHVDCSIGISIYPEDGEDAETLIENADAAMYHGKEKGPNNFQLFETSMKVAATPRARSSTA